MDRGFLKKAIAVAGGIITAIFTVVPEDIFKYGFVTYNLPDAAVVCVNRLIVCAAVFVLSYFGCYLYLTFRRRVTISEKSNTIKVEYKNLFKVKKGHSEILYKHYLQ